MKYILVYFAAISLLSVIVTVWDKKAARLHAMRVPEAVLLLLAALGGGLSMYVTMFITHHKTRKLKFMIGIPVIFVLQICLLLFAVWRWSEGQI